MLYDTHHRFNDALHPDALTSIETALHALNAAVRDCQQAGKLLDQDPAVQILIRHLAEVASRAPVSPAELRSRCATARQAVINRPALLAIAGNRVGDAADAKRTFHAQARRAVKQLIEAIGLNAEAARITTLGAENASDGITELSHPEVGIRVVPRGFLPDSEVSFWRCKGGKFTGTVYRAPIAELLDHAAFERRLASTIGTFRPAFARAA